MPSFESQNLVSHICTKLEDSSVAPLESFDSVWRNIKREIEETVHTLQQDVAVVDFGASLSGDRLLGNDDQCFALLVEFGGDVEKKLSELDELKTRPAFMTGPLGRSDSLSALPHISNKFFGEAPENVSEEFRNIVIISDSAPKYWNESSVEDKELCQGEKEVDWSVEEEPRCGDKQCSFKYLTEDQIFSPLRERKIGLTAWVRNDASEGSRKSWNSPANDYSWLCDNNKQYFRDTSCVVTDLVAKKEATPNNDESKGNQEQTKISGYEASTLAQAILEQSEECVSSKSGLSRSNMGRMSFINSNECMPCPVGVKMTEDVAMKCFNKASPVCKVDISVVQPLRVLCYRDVLEGAQIIFQLKGYSDHYGRDWPMKQLRFWEIKEGPVNQKAIRIEKFRDIGNLQISTCSYSRNATDLVAFKQAKPYRPDRVKIVEASDTTPGAFYALTLEKGFFGRPNFEYTFGDQTNSYNGLPFVSHQRSRTSEHV